MGKRIETIDIGSSSEFSKSMLQLTGNDMRDTGIIFSFLESRFDEDEAQRIWIQMLSKAREIVLGVTDAVENRSEMVMLMCAMCLHIMLSVAANAQELAFDSDLNGMPIAPLVHIYGKEATPPPAR